MQLCYEDGSLEADGTHPRAILQIPQHHLPILPRTQEVAVIGGPAERLYLARMAAQLASNAICLDIKDDNNAVVLRRAIRIKYMGYAIIGPYPPRCEQIAAVTEADRGGMAAAYVNRESRRARCRRAGTFQTHAGGP